MRDLIIISAIFIIFAVLSNMDYNDEVLAHATVQADKNLDD